MPDLFLLPSDAKASLPTHSFIFSLHSPFLRSVIFKPMDSNITLSLPFTASCLEKLLELLSKGLVSSDSRQQLEEVKEAVNALGFSLPDDSNVVAVTDNKSIGGSVKQDSFDVKTLKVELDEKTLSCNNCGKRYKSLEGLQKHIKKKKHGIQSLTGEEFKAQFSCATCPGIFSTKSKLEIHTKKYHLETDEKSLVDSVTGEVGKNKLTCRFCPKMFTCRKHQQRHMSSVHSTKVISCERCGKQFSRGDHMRRHKGSSLCIQDARQLS